MFPAMYTHYYWEEKREEIYRSAPTRTRVSRGRRTGARRGGRGWREKREAVAECLAHGATWSGHLEQLTQGLCGRVLPSRPDFKEQLAATVCSCDERDREKCRRAAARLGFTAGSNLPPLELNNRMRFNELYFHNILNSPQFTSEYIDNCEDQDPIIDIIRGLHAARTAIFALVQRCVLGNDLKAYRLLDIIRLYTQKPHKGKLCLPLPAEEGPALEMLQTLEKGDHMNVVAKLFGCQIVLGLSNEASPPMLELNLSTANINDINGVEEYFHEPYGYRKPEPAPKPVNKETKPEVAADAGPADAAKGKDEEASTKQSQNQSDSAQNEANTIKDKVQQKESRTEPEETLQAEQSGSAEATEQSVSISVKSISESGLQQEAASTSAGAVADPSDAAPKTNSPIMRAGEATSVEASTSSARILKTPEQVSATAIPQTDQVSMNTPPDQPNSAEAEQK